MDFPLQHIGHSLQTVPMPTATVTQTPLVGGGSVCMVTIDFNREPSSHTNTTHQSDESSTLAPLSPSEQVGHTNITTQLRNLERYYSSFRATEYRNEINRLFPLNRIVKTFRQKKKRKLFCGRREVYTWSYVRTGKRWDTDYTTSM